MKIFTLLLLLISLLFSSKLTKSGNYVIDDKNKLMWQDNMDNVKVIVTYETAKDYCGKLVLGGFRNWRVPTVDEYKSIIDKTRKDEIMINRKFKYILPEGYWTADDTWRNFGLWAYYIYFKSGTAYYENRTYPKLVRCVRSLK
ncbi:MAG: DUF1566 domain-containing protein [Campylobacterota bacterium]|nr:DUF1566 domain-containing protein [Campylobacterota bacterium]